VRASERTGAIAEAAQALVAYQQQNRSPEKRLINPSSTGRALAAARWSSCSCR